MAVTTSNNFACNHYETNVDDTIVCFYCKKVLNNIVFSPSSSIKYENENENTDENDIIFELLGKNIITKKVLIDAKHFQEKWCKLKIPLKKYHKAYSIYYACKHNNFPLSVKEIAFYFQTSVKNILKCEKYIKNDFNQYAIDFLNLFSVHLGLTFMDQKIIEKTIYFYEKKIQKSPSMTTASCILLTFPNIDKKKLCEISYLSIGAIMKTVKEMKKTTVLKHEK